MSPNPGRQTETPLLAWNTGSCIGWNRTHHTNGNVRRTLENKYWQEKRNVTFYCPKHSRGQDTIILTSAIRAINRTCLSNSAHLFKMWIPLNSGQENLRILLVFWSLIWNCLIILLELFKKVCPFFFFFL